MPFKDILGVVLSASKDEPVLAAMDVLASGAARSTALLIEAEPDSVYTDKGGVVGGWPDILKAARQTFTQEAEALRARGRLATHAFETREAAVTATNAAAEAAAHARNADLTIMLRPSESWSAASRNEIFESVLFGSGRPVLLIPPQWRKSTIGRRVIVAWNGAREAARAVADAGPLLAEAEQVVVVTVDARHSECARFDTTCAGVVAHLAHRGVRVEPHELRGSGCDQAEAIAGEAARCGADLIVMGGYGKPRLREMVLGGVTRVLTQTSPVPLLLSH